jgi:alkylhydroperoxidase/carboxymuconolactone decarboxylase family protein YurZ
MNAKLPPVEYLRSIHAGSAEAFQALRKAVMKAGPLDHTTCELISLGALVTARHEESFKVHARRLLKEGVDVAALRHAVLSTFGASTTFSQIVEGLAWIDDLVPPAA